MSQGLEWSILKAKSLSFDLDLNKGLHDALYHHAMYAEAAKRAMQEAPYSPPGTQAPSTPNDRNALSRAYAQHCWMLCRHALECMRDIDPYLMSQKLIDTIRFYQDLAAAKSNSDEMKSYVKKVLEDGYQSDSSDEFEEDYEDEGEPDIG